MPTRSEHEAFVRSRPYPHWYLIWADVYIVGAVYLTTQDEIGIGILRAFRRHGYASEAIALLLRKHPGKRFLANINPLNTKSVALFQKLGFKGPIQVTYEQA